MEKNMEAKQEKSIYVNWGGGKVKLTWKKDIPILPSQIVTSVHAICVKDGLVMLALIEGRGFNILGGHIEKGEKIEQALLREIYEEGYVKGNLTYIGCIEVNHEENLLFDPNGKYPLIGYQAFYRCDITHIYPFERQYESRTRIWVEASEITYVIHDHELIKFIFEDALN